MKKGKWLIGLCMAAAFAFCGLFAACGGDESGKPPVTPENPSGPGGGSAIEVWDLKLVGERTRTLEIDASDEEPVTDTLAWTVTKDGETVTTEPVEVTVTGDAVTYNATTHTVTAVKVGTATATITLTGHDDVLPLSVSYEVVDYFFSTEIQRGGIIRSNESEGEVHLISGQATIVAEKPGTKWVFRATLTPVDYTGTEAFGVGSFLDAGDHALWYGLHNQDGQKDAKFSIYRKAFYEGWGSGSDLFPQGYGNRGFDLTNGIECEIIRDGEHYYYCIDTFYGDETITGDAATYPGIFSQEQYVTVTDFSVSYDETDVADAIAAYSSKGVASIVINETNKARLLKGTSQTYTATCYPTGKVSEVTWSLDKSGMTAGADGTTVANGNLQLADDAAGTVVLKCEAGTASDTLTITIISETEDKENEQLKVTGGALLESNGDVVFPDYMAATDGVGQEEYYTDPGYGAVLKQKVKGNFSIEFTVSDYVAGSDAPKLMISFGSDHNQFYIVYKRDGCRIETYTRHLYDNVVHASDWVNTDYFDEDFDASIAHRYKIEVTDGIYTVSVDNGDALVFKTNSGSRVSTLVRQFADCNAELPIRIATKNASARVSNIQVTQKSETLPEYFGYDVQEAENGFGLQFYANNEGDGWDQTRNRVVRTAATPSDNFTLTMNIKFSAPMTDAKAIVNLGDKELQFCNKLTNGELLLELVSMNGDDVTWPSVGKYPIPHDGTYTIALRIERQGTQLRIIGNGVELCRPTCNVGSNLKFSVFNTNGKEFSCTVQFTGIAFDDYEESKIYTIENLANDVTLSVNGEKELTYEVKCNNNTPGDAYTAEVTADESGHISYDAQSKKFKALFEGDGTLTITIKVNGDVVCTATVTVHVTARETASSNANWEVKGGVVLYTDDDSIEFPVANQGTDGVGKPEYYEDNAYSANYKGTVIGNFSIKFTVSNYKTTAQFPKLMISLGGTNEQFYVVYKTDGTCRIETYTRSSKENGEKIGGQWVNSAAFADFDASEEHTFEIKVMSGGLYEVYLDDTTKITGFNMDGEPRTIYRPYEDYASEQPIRISTNGVSCTVSDIVVTNGTAEDVRTNVTGNRNWFAHSVDHITSITDNGFTMAFANHSWDARNNNENRIFYTEAIDLYFTAEFDLMISAQMTDTKFVAMFGNYQVMIVIKGNEIKCNVAPGHDDWGENAIPEATIGSEFHIKIINAGDGFKVYSGEGGSHLVHTKDAAKSVSPFSFYAFSQEASDSVTATVSNLTVS